MVDSFFRLTTSNCDEDPFSKFDFRILKEELTRNEKNNWHTIFITFEKMKVVEFSTDDRSTILL
jgi:hypothetical protein